MERASEQRIHQCCQTDRRTHAGRRTQIDVSRYRCTQTNTQIDRHSGRHTDTRIDKQMRLDSHRQTDNTHIQTDNTRR